MVPSVEDLREYATLGQWRCTLEEQNEAVLRLLERLDAVEAALRRFMVDVLVSPNMAARTLRAALAAHEASKRG